MAATTPRYRAVTGVTVDRYYRGGIVFWHGRTIALPEHVVALYEHVLWDGPRDVDPDAPGLRELLELELLTPAA